MRSGYFRAEQLHTEPRLFYLDLRTNLTVEDFISPSILHHFSLPSNMTPNAAVVNEDNAAFLWYSNDTLYVPDLSSPPGNTVAAFNTTTEDWSFLSVSGDNIRLNSIGSELDHRSSEMSASVPSSGLAFSFGDFARPGLVKFDSSESKALTWTNQTSGGSQGIQVPLVSEAEMVHVPLGKQGVLLAMGGMDVRFLFFVKPITGKKKL